MIFPGHSDQKNESARKIHFDLYKKIIKKFWKRKKLEVIKVRKIFGREFSRSKIFDFFRSHFSYIFEWKFSKFLRSKNFHFFFDFFHSKLYEKIEIFENSRPNFFEHWSPLTFFVIKIFWWSFFMDRSGFSVRTHFFDQNVPERSLEGIKRKMLYWVWWFFWNYK